MWIIKDSGKRISTGLAAQERAEAERRLAEYLAAKHEPSREREQSPAAIPVADALNVYLTDKGSTVGRPGELARRVAALANFFGEKTLADINGALCRAARIVIAGAARA